MRVIDYRLDSGEQAMTITYSLPPTKTSSSRCNRNQQIEYIHDFETTAEQKSQRAWAKEHGIPRSTLQYWHNRHQQAQADPAAAFFESQPGLECLHRIVVAAQFVITQLAGGSVRHCSTFLQLSQLDRFAAPSVGSQHKSIVAMEQAICDFGLAERARLAPQMPHRNLILAEDETFHPDVCLVAIDTAARYIVLERYTEDRKAETWNHAVNEALEGLNVSVIQCVSDQATALVCHIEKGLGVHQAPDLFHVQHELCKATSLALARQTKDAQEALEKGEQADKEQLQQSLNEAESRQQRAKAATRGLSVDYHPVDWQTGELKNAEELSHQLEQRLDEAAKVATEAGLSEKSHKRIRKARRVVPKMVKTFLFFMRLMGLRLGELGLDARQSHRFCRHLFAGRYLEAVAKRQKKAEDRKTLQARAEGILRGWYGRDGPAHELGEERQRQLEQVAEECVQMFARASSLTEGRNAELRRHHRNSHRLSNRKLGALTVVRNFFVRGRDQSSAAERFFGQKPRDLFEHLIESLEVPKRPAKRRN